MFDYKVVLQGDGGRRENYVLTHAYRTLEECQAHLERLWAQGVASIGNWIEVWVARESGEGSWQRVSPVYNGEGREVEQ